MASRIQAWLDQEDARLREVIRLHGWAIEYVGGGCCSVPGCDGGDDEGSPFAYTVGLFGLGHPELLVFSLDMHDSQGLLNTVGGDIRAGGDLIPGIEFSVGGWPPKVIAEEVPNPGDIVFTANRFYQRPDEFSVPVLQLTYSDENGIFPWDERFDEPGSQPRPGSFTA
jgi:hypothetical protein